MTETQRVATGLQPRGIVATELSVSYEHKRVLKGLDLDIPASQFTAIIGPNGSGKSTLLRSIVRLVPSTSESLSVAGLVVSTAKRRDLARTIGMQFQHHSFPPGVTASEAIGIGRFPYTTILKRWSTDDEQAVNDAARLVSVEDLIESRLDELSGGQQQKVWVASLLAQETSILLLDEPTSSLDIANQVEILELLKSLSTRGKTVVAVLHDLNQAARFADHLVLMADGHVVTSGSPREVLTVGNLSVAYGIRVRILEDPDSSVPIVLPFRQA